MENLISSLTRRYAELKIFLPSRSPAPFPMVGQDLKYLYENIMYISSGRRSLPIFPKFPTLEESGTSLGPVITHNDGNYDTNVIYLPTVEVLERVILLHLLRERSVSLRVQTGRLGFRHDGGSERSL